MNEEEKSGERRQSFNNRSNEGSLYSKRRELLQEMKMGDGRGPLPVREQVRKLKPSSKGQSATNEDDWGRKEKRKKGSLWILWAVLGLAVPVVLVALVLIGSRARKATEERVTDLRFDLGSHNANEIVEPQDWFVENAGEAFSRGFEILEALNKDDLSAEEVQNLVRNPKQAARIMKELQAGEWAGFDTSDVTGIRWSVGSTESLGLMIAEGVRKDYHNFRAYFLREEGEIKLDADATDTISQAAIKTLPDQPLIGVVQLRCWIAKEPHFDARSDEQVYSWYQIIAPNEIDFIWAYVRKGDPLDQLLREELNYGRVIGGRKKQFRGIVTLSAAEDFRNDEFLLEELLSTEWSLPNEG